MNYYKEFGMVIVQWDLEKLKSRDKAQVPAQLFANVGIDFVPPLLSGRHKQVNAKNTSKFNAFPGKIELKSCEDRFLHRESYQERNVHGRMVQKYRFVATPSIPIPEKFRRTNWIKISKHYN